MARPHRQIEKIGSLGRGGFVILDVVNGLIDQVFGQMIVVAGRCFDRLIVAVELGIPLIGKGALEAVPPIKTASERPVRKGAGCAHFLHGRQVPFADGDGPVAVISKNFGKRGCPAGHKAAIAGKPGRPFRNCAHADGVGVPSRQKTRARWRAHRYDVKIRVANAAPREPVHVRRIDFRSKATEIGEADVVQQDEDDVWSLVWCLSSPAPRPPSIRRRCGPSRRQNCVSPDMAQ